MKKFFKKNSDENSERGHFLKLMLNILKSFENHSMIYYFWYLFVQRKNTLHLGTLKQVLKYELIQKKVYKVNSTQSCLESYLDIKTELEKSSQQTTRFFKLMNYTAYQKTYERFKKNTVLYNL